MIEEVGAEYLNSYIDQEDYPPDETSPGSVLRDIEDHYPSSGDFDTEKIKNQVIDARNDISHYVTRRGEVVEIEDFEEFYDGVIEGMELVDRILTDLIERPISDFHDQLQYL